LPHTCVQAMGSQCSIAKHRKLDASQNPLE
jgi:hypothetical protein